jgi:hypothetical protein
MNNTPTSTGPLIAQGARAQSGLEQLGATVNTLHNTPSSFGPVLYAFAGRKADPTATPPVAPIQGAQSRYVEARAEHAMKRGELRAAVAGGRAFMAHAVDTLKKPLGRRWNSQWAAVGFTNGSLELSTDPLPALGFLAEYWRAHADREIPALELTAKKAEEARTAIVAGQTAAAMARVAEASAKQARDIAKKALQKKIASLRGELGSLLTPDDPRWYAFGFRRPIDRGTPDLVEEVDLRLAGAGEVIAEWPKARLAENYRVAWKVTGSAEPPTQVGLVIDPRAVITGLPRGVSITVIVTARNGAGESAPTETVIGLP